MSPRDTAYLIYYKTQFWTINTVIYELPYFNDRAVIPEPRGLGKNGWRYDDLYSRIIINSKFGVFWPLSTRLPGTALNLAHIISYES